MKPHFAGLDIGSTTTKAVVLDECGFAVASAVRPTGALALATADLVLEEAIEAAGANRESARICCTGYGRDLFETASRRPTEIACLAMGVHHSLASAGTAIDIGGQDLKVVTIAPGGRHANFIMNDRCAAGTGRFLEVMARVLGVPLEDIGESSLRSSNPAKISSMCTVFAESEVVSMIARGCAVEDILSGVHEAIAERIASQAGRLGIRGDVAIAGGGALNPGLLEALGRRLGTDLLVPPNPQLSVALGAALIALRDRA